MKDKTSSYFWLEKAAPYNLVEMWLHEELGSYYNANGEPVRQVTLPQMPKAKDFNGDVIAFGNAMKQYLEQQNELVPEMAEALNRAINNRTNAFIRKYQDEDVHISSLQNYVKKNGGEVTDESDVYNDKNRSHGRKTFLSEEFERKEMAELVKAYKAIVNSKEIASIPNLKEIPADTTQSIRKIGLYLQAKDIQEAIELGLKDRGEYGFYDATGMTFEEYIEMFEEAIPQRDIDKLWKAVRAATGFALDIEYENGLIPTADYNRYKSREYYVPQRGWEDRDTSTDPEHYLAGAGARYGDPYNAVIVKAKGRNSLAGDPLNYIQSLGHSAIVAAEKNRVKNKAWNLVTRNIAIGRKSGAFNFKKVWYVNTGERTDAGELIYDEVFRRPDQRLFDEDAKTYAQLNEMQAKARAISAKIRAAEKAGDNEAQAEASDELNIIRNEMDELREKINIKSDHQNARKAMRTAMEKKQHEVVVYHEGEKYILFFNNENVANAINGNREDIINSDIINMIGKATRWYSSMMTQYNPSFAAYNLIRDVQLANISLFAEQGILFGLNFNKNMLLSHGALSRHMAGKFDANDPVDNMLMDFFKEGGATGYSYLKDLEQIRKELKSQIDPSFMHTIGSSKANVLNGKALGKLFGALTEYSEVMTRFAVYRTAVESGMSKEKAASMAKEVTVNFDRKGADIGVISKLFAFFNASIQGIAKTTKMVGKHKGKMGSLIVGLMVGGLINTLMNPDEPEDEKAYSEYGRNNNRKGVVRWN